MSVDSGSTLRAYYVFDRTADDWFLCHARSCREAKRLFWDAIRAFCEDTEFTDVRVRRAPRYDRRSLSFDAPAFDDAASPECTRCGRWECNGGSECHGEEW